MATADQDIAVPTRHVDAPRFTRSDSPLGAQPSLPGYAGSATEVQGRWWFSAGRADLGMGFGTFSYGMQPTGSIAGVVGSGAVGFSSGTVLTLGVRYRTSNSSAVFADASNLRGYPFYGNDAVVGKVGLELKSAQSFFNISYGGLGMRLAGDTRVVVRPSRGGLALSMRSSF